MLFRALVIWFVILGAAFVNGALRVTAIIPALGEYPGHVISCFTLSALILLVAWIAMPWIGPASIGDAALVGGIWLALVLAFEFLAGHYLFSNPWEKLLRVRDPARPDLGARAHRDDRRADLGIPALRPPAHGQIESLELPTGSSATSQILQRADRYRFETPVICDGTERYSSRSLPRTAVLE